MKINLGSACVSPHLRILRALGVCGTDPNAAVTIKYAHVFYRIVAQLIGSAYFIQEIGFYFEDHNKDEYTRATSLFLVHISFMVKQYVFIFHGDKVDQLVRMLEDPLFNHTKEEHMALRKKAVTFPAKILKVALVLIIFLTFLWFLTPLLAHIRRAPALFYFWTVVDPNQPINFEIIMFESTFMYYFAGMGNYTADLFITTIMYQCKCQLSILRSNLENIKNLAHKLQIDTRDNLDTIMTKLLVESMKHYDHIVATMALCEKLFGFAILVQFTFISWTLCLAVYNLVAARLFSSQFFSLFTFVAVVFVKLFLYCFFGSDLMYESQQIVDSIWSCGWEHTGVKFRRALIVFMSRTNRPLCPRAVKFLPVTLNTFMKIAKSTTTIYAVLKQSKDK